MSKTLSKELFYNRSMTLFWKLYYKYKFKGEYNARIESAQKLHSYMSDATAGRLNLFYNTDGVNIRSWHRKRPSFVTDNRHPLERKYHTR